ncbi:AAA family ATPase [Paenibacillus sp. y28]|uniref:AAA family ATPase n=1 Tax=Paenibacillus sp. y28 TaxID=3129110 RepID=UPI0030179945
MKEISPTGNQEGITLRDIMKGQKNIMPDHFLALARAIAACVGDLHQQQRIHLDLRPESIRMASEECTWCRLHEGNTLKRLADGYERPTGSGLPESDLTYCSPENTGRMLRAVDERSDLYSLGVIFYEMLAGRPPFQANNPLEWVYMHLAQSPPPISGEASLPDGLEAVIMKLLEKNPDKRYQSAGFLLADLDKVGRHQDTLFIEPGVHGREYELSVLKQSFYSVCLGSTEMVFISGEAGIGKTSLMNEMFRKQHTPDFFYITGKFEQLSKEIPYHPIIQAFRGFMRHLLGERKDQSALWKRKLKKALGANAHVITEIIPEAGLILGEVPAVEKLPANESKKRFIYIFRKFVQALASKERPVVLFIDDLQWADHSSLHLIHALLSDPECQYFMFVCAYRHAEIEQRALPGYEPDGRVTEQAVIRHIHLSPLSLEQMNRIVMETLNSPAETTLPLTELLYHKSGGNPFHCKQILIRLQDTHTLLYDPVQRCWQWNLGPIIALEPSYAIQDLMAHKLQRLSSGAHDLARIAACVGGEFQAQFIARMVKGDPEPMAMQWTELEAEGLILQAGAGTFRFAHDHIQKMIYNSIDDHTKQALHVRIGNCIREAYAGFEESLFEAVNHLNRGSKTITGAQERLLLVRMNLDAGSRAKSSSASDVALGYFKCGAALLSPENWNTEFGLCFELYAQKAECEYLCGHTEQSNQDISFLLGCARSPVDRSRVQLIQIMQYINQGKYLKGTTLGLESLRAHQITIPPNPESFLIHTEGKRIERLLRNTYERIASLPEMSDPEQIAAMNLIAAIIPSTFFTNKQVYFLLMCKAIELALRYGNTPETAAVYSAYGMFLGTSLGQYDKGYAIAKAGVELAERYNMASSKSKTYTIFGGVLCQFAGNAREGDAYLARALRFGLDSGDYVFASYAIGAHVNSLYTRAPLSELAKAITDYMAVLDTTRDEFVRQNFYLYLQFILALQGRTAAPDSLDSEDFEEEAFLNRIHKEETSATTLFQYGAYKTQLCYLLGRYEEAARWARRAETHTAYAAHLPHMPECLFYESLAVLAARTPASGHFKADNSLVRKLRRFTDWAKWSPASYQARACLLQAEYARVSGEFQAAEALYDKAIREAREHGNLPVTSLAGELAANYYLKRDKRKSALFYLKIAVEGYRQWGVQIKSVQLEELLLQWQSQENAALAGGAVQTLLNRNTAETVDGAARHQGGPPSLDRVDLEAILATAQAITNQMDMDAMLGKIMNTIMKYAGAGKGALLTASNDTLLIQIYAEADEAQPVPGPLEMTDSSLLPEGIIRYVFRTQENVHYSAGEESWLIHNPYIAKHHPGSALCIPVTVHGTMLGVLYLENKLASGVFAHERMTVIRAMASHGLFMCVLESSPAFPTAAAGMEDHIQPLPGIMEEPLTDRELEVLALLSAGLSNKEIADHLVIAMNTVKVHVKNIFAKLKVNRRTKAVAQAKELKLLDQGSQPVLNRNFGENRNVLHTPG